MLAQKPSDDELLSLYGLFKQATVGDNNTGTDPRSSYLFPFSYALGSTAWNDEP